MSVVERLRTTRRAAKDLCHSENKASNVLEQRQTNAKMNLSNGFVTLAREEAGPKRGARSLCWPY